MPRKEDYHRLFHIWEAATEAVSFTQGATREALDADRKLQHTLIHLLEIIGEAAGRITQTFRDNHPEIPWVMMIGMRDRMIHAYFAINLNVVWYTVTENLPSLISAIQPLLADEGLV
jgi:uncharacterized protein with HEPN domain